MNKDFENIYYEIIESLRGNLTQSEYRELITLEYVLTHGYDKSGDKDRYRELRNKKYEQG